MRWRAAVGPLNSNQPKETTMRSKAVWALVALNVLLLTTLVGQWLRPNAASAQAQLPRPSDYIFIPGVIQGSPADIVYVIDTQNGLLSARLYDGQNLQDMAPISLAKYFQQAGPNSGARRGRGY
jgi:hypothetical protein